MVELRTRIGGERLSVERDGVLLKKIGKEANTLSLKYQKIEIPKKNLKTVKQQRRDLQYYQLERLTMNPVMYPAAWASDTEVLTYYN